MIDRRTEIAIKEARAFVEYWTKFHAIYKSVCAKGIITQDDEEKFLAAKQTIQKKYEDLTAALDLRYTSRGRLTDPVSAILQLENIRFASEKNLKVLNDDWRDSYVFLNSILERLKSKKRRLGQFNPVGVFFKKLFEGGGLRA